MSTFIENQVVRVRPRERLLKKDKKIRDSFWYIENENKSFTVQTLLPNEVYILEDLPGLVWEADWLEPVFSYNRPVFYDPITGRLHLIRIQDVEFEITGEEFDTLLGD